MPFAFAMEKTFEIVVRFYTTRQSSLSSLLCEFLRALVKITLLRYSFLGNHFVSLLLDSLFFIN